MDDVVTKAHYIGSGEYHSGIPARDLTEDEWNGLTDEQQALLASSSLYRLTQGAKDDVPANPAKVLAKAAMPEPDPSSAAMPADGEAR